MTAWIAAWTGELAAGLWEVFYFIVLPMLLLVLVGYLLQRRLRMDMRTLTNLNFYFVMPPIIYHSLVTSQVRVGQVGTVIAFSLTLLTAMSVLTWLVACLRRVPAGQRRTLVLTTMLFNSGNFGLPLQERAFADRGLSGPATAIQAIVMVVQNIFTFTAGIFIAAGGRKDRHWKQNLLHILKLPPLYAVAAALITVQCRRLLGEASPELVRAIEPWWKSVTYLKNAFIAVALCTLGAQLATVKHDLARYPVKFSVFLRLLMGPALALGVVYLYGLSGFIAQVLLIASTAPTAVNCLLLCMEFDNNPDYAAAAVFYSTLLSPVTVTLMILLVQGGFLPRLVF